MSKPFFDLSQLTKELKQAATGFRAAREGLLPVVGEEDAEKIATLEEWAQLDFSDRNQLHKAVTEYYLAVIWLDQQLARVTNRQVCGEINGDLVQLEGELRGVYRQEDLEPVFSGLPDGVGTDGLRRALSPFKSKGRSWEAVLEQLGRYPFC